MSTTTVVNPALLVQPLTVTVTEYVPASADVTFEIDVFCVDAVKLFGPVQEYVAPATAAVDRFNVDPWQIGLLFDGEGVAGVGLTTTVTVVGTLAQPLFAVTV